MGAISIPVQPLRRAPQAVPKAVPAFYPDSQGSRAAHSSPLLERTHPPLVRIHQQSGCDLEKL